MRCIRRRAAASGRPWSAGVRIAISGGVAVRRPDSSPWPTDWKRRRTRVTPTALFFSRRRVSMSRASSRTMPRSACCFSRMPGRRICGRTARRRGKNARNFTGRRWSRRRCCTARIWPRPKTPPFCRRPSTPTFTAGSRITSSSIFSVSRDAISRLSRNRPPLWPRVRASCCTAISNRRTSSCVTAG